MLVLSRKTGQELVIGDDIRITINRVSGRRVTIGVSAPQDVRIIRGELEPFVKSFDDADTPKKDSPDQTHSGLIVDHETNLNDLTRQLH